MRVDGRRAAKAVSAATVEVSRLFPSPGSLTEDADEELYDALVEVDDALAAIAGGLRRDGFATGAYNACIATLDDVLSSRANVLTAEQVQAVTRLREAVTAFG